MHLTCYLYNLKKFFNFTDLKLLIYVKWSTFILNFDNFMFKFQLIRIFSLIGAIILNIVIFIIIPFFILCFDYNLTQFYDFFGLSDFSVLSSLNYEIPASFGEVYSSYIKFLTDLLKNPNFMNIFNLGQYNYLIGFESFAEKPAVSDDNLSNPNCLLMENNNNNQIVNSNINNNNNNNTSNTNNLQPALDDYQEMRSRPGELSDVPNICKFMIINDTLVTTQLTMVDNYDSIIENNHTNEGQKLYATNVRMGISNTLQYKEPERYDITSENEAQVAFGLPDGNSIPHKLTLDFKRDAEVTVNSHRVENNHNIIDSNNEDEDQP